MIGGFKADEVLVGAAMASALLLLLMALSGAAGMAGLPSWPQVLCQSVIARDNVCYVLCDAVYGVSVHSVRLRLVR